MAADMCRVLGYPESSIKNSLSNLIDAARQYMEGLWRA
jgi:hypothetical protein